MTRRQRLRVRTKFTAPGTITNYEMDTVRREGTWRNSRWRLIWAALGDAFHPRSQEEWNEHKRQGDHDGH